MTQRSASRPGGTGRVVLWVVLLALALLLGWITWFAIQHNPLYSDVENNGVSKFKFIELCKGKLPEAQKALATGLGAQPGAPKILNADLAAEGVALVKAVQEVPKGGWTMTVPASVGAELTNPQSGEKVNQTATIPFRCSVDARTEKVEAQLVTQ